MVAIPSSLEMDVEQVTQHVAAIFGNYFIQKDFRDFTLKNMKFYLNIIYKNSPSRNFISLSTNDELE